MGCHQRSRRQSMGTYWPKYPVCINRDTYHNSPNHFLPNYGCKCCHGDFVLLDWALRQSDCCPYRSGNTSCTYTSNCSIKGRCAKNKSLRFGRLLFWRARIYIFETLRGWWADRRFGFAACSVGWIGHGVSQRRSVSCRPWGVWCLGAFLNLASLIKIRFIGRLSGIYDMLGGR